MGVDRIIYSVHQFLQMQEAEKRSGRIPEIEHPFTEVLEFARMFFGYVARGYAMRRLQSYITFV